MREASLQELQEMADKLLATARNLPSGQDRHNTLREIRSFHVRIAALKFRRTVSHHLGARSVNCQPLPLISDEGGNDLLAIARDRISAH